MIQSEKEAMERVIAAADKIIEWRGTEGFEIVDPNLREYVDARKALEEMRIALTPISVPAPPGMSDGRGGFKKPGA